MRHALLLAALIVPGSVLAATPKPKAAPRFDGLYQEYPPVVDSSDNEHRWYLRFYEDGTVVQKETISAPEKWTSKLERENEKIDKGSYKAADGRLTYDFLLGGDGYKTTYSAEGRFLPGGKLELSITSLTVFDRLPAGTPYTIKRTFAFMKIKTPAK